MSNIKYIGSDTKISEKGKVHELKNSSETGCGVNIRDNREDWESTFESVNCQKNGCKN